jgi:hypothetical protein
MKKFDEKVKEVVRNVCDQWGLRVVVAADNDILVIGSGFALRFYLDRDGVSLTYLKRKENGVFEYALGHFLATGGYWVSAPLNEDVILRELLSYALTLEVSREIFQEDDSWTKCVLETPIFPDDPVFKLI